MPRHVINLASAWEPPPPGEASWTRRFGRPTGVQAGDRLLLVCAAGFRSEVWRQATLNGLPLTWRDTAPNGLECDVTDLLGDRNTLVVPAGSAGTGAMPPPHDSTTRWKKLGDGHVRGQPDAVTLVIVSD